MKLRNPGIIIAASIATLATISCTTTTTSTTPSAAPASSPPATAAEAPQLDALYAGLAKSGGKVFALDPKTSAVRIYAFRGGTAAKVGHNHVLSAPKFTGFFHLPASGTGDARFDLEFRLDELEIDNPEYRAGLGSAFSSVLPPGAIEGTRDHMLGEDNLEADKYPFVRVHSVQLTGESPKFAAKVRVEMHGQSREIWVPLTVEGLPDRLSASGSFVLRQTDFGAKPYSVLGGLLAVQDEVVIDFKLSGR